MVHWILKPCNNFESSLREFADTCVVIIKQFWVIKWQFPAFRRSLGRRPRFDAFDTMRLEKKDFILLHAKAMEYDFRPLFESEKVSLKSV